MFIRKGKNLIYMNIEEKVFRPWDLRRWLSYSIGTIISTNSVYAMHMVVYSHVYGCIAMYRTVYLCIGLYTYV